MGLYEEYIPRPSEPTNRERATQALTDSHSAPNGEWAIAYALHAVAYAILDITESPSNAD